MGGGTINSLIDAPSKITELSTKLKKISEIQIEDKIDLGISDIFEKEYSYRLNLDFDPSLYLMEIYAIHLSVGEKVIYKINDIDFQLAMHFEENAEIIINNIKLNKTEFSFKFNQISTGTELVITRIIAIE